MVSGKGSGTLKNLGLSGVDIGGPPLNTSCFLCLGPGGGLVSRLLDVTPSAGYSSFVPLYFLPGSPQPGVDRGSLSVAVPSGPPALPINSATMQRGAPCAASSFSAACSRSSA